MYPFTHADWCSRMKLKGAQINLHCFPFSCEAQNIDPWPSTRKKKERRKINGFLMSVSFCCEEIPLLVSKIRDLMIKAMFSYSKGLRSFSG
jgi:hypothetical protein